MRQRINLDKHYADALEQVEPLLPDAVTPLQLPTSCPFTLDDMLRGKLSMLKDLLRAASLDPPH